MKKTSNSSSWIVLVSILGAGIIIGLVTVSILIGLQPCGWLDGVFNQSVCLYTIDHHSVSKVTFIPNGTTLATLSINDDTVSFWTTDTTPPQKRESLKSPMALDIALSPDQTSWALSHRDRTDLFVNGDSRILEGLSRAFTIAFEPTDGNVLAGGSTIGVELWRVDDGSLLYTLEPDISRYDRLPVNSIAFSPDGKLLASGGGNKSIDLWQVDNGAHLRVLKGHTGSVESVTFSPDGEVLASGGSDRIVRLWQVNTGTLLNTLEGHSGFIFTLAYSPDGEVLASGGSDGTVRIWRAHDGKLLYTLRSGAWYRNWVQSIVFYPDGTKLVLGQRYGPVKVFDVRKMLNESTQN